MLVVLTVPEVCLPIVITEGLGDSQQTHLSICEHSAASSELGQARFPHTADGGGQLEALSAVTRTWGFISHGSRQ